MKDIKGVIFDMDGTLLDSMTIWETAEADYLISQGISPRPGLSEELRVLGGLEVPLYFQAEYGLKKPVFEIRDGINIMLEDFYSHRVMLKQGVIGVLETLYARCVKMCVATATDRCLAEPGLQRCGILSYFERVFTCGEENTGKSSPLFFLRAANYLGTGISDTLIVEDSLFAMETAKKAGFKVAAVYDASSDDHQAEIRSICDYYLETMDDMLRFL